MKKLILLLVIAFLIEGINSAKSQTTFTLSELEKLCSFNSSSFETFILQRGYSYQSSFSDEVTKIYWCDAKRPNGRQDQISRTPINSFFSSIIFTTTSKQYYLNLKSVLDKNNYKFIREEQRKLVDMTTTWYYYSNNSFTPIIYSYTTSDGVTTYNVQISKD